MTWAWVPHSWSFVREINIFLSRRASNVGLWHLFVASLNKLFKKQFGLVTPLHSVILLWCTATYLKVHHLLKPNLPVSICAATKWASWGFFKTWRPRQNGHHFPDDIFTCIFLNENVWFSAENSLKIVPVGPINNIPTLVQIMAWCWSGDKILSNIGSDNGLAPITWRQSGDKPLSEPMMVSLLMHICITPPQWVECVTRLTYNKLW